MVVKDKVDSPVALFARYRPSRLVSQSESEDVPLAGISSQKNIKTSWDGVV
jgi:hypothetical protein